MNDPLVEIKVEQGILRVILSGDVTLVEASTVKKMVTQATESSLRPQGIVLDLSGAGHIYSPALGRLLGLLTLPLPLAVVVSPIHADLFGKLGIADALNCCVTVADAFLVLGKGATHGANTDGF
jgi:anti-anti-sigma regulatory factor